MPRSASEERLIARGAARWPAFVVDGERFVAWVRGHLAGGDADALHAEDLYLAWACAEGDPAAIAAFRAAYDGHLAAILGRTGVVDRDEARAQVYQQLLVATAEQPPGIARYAGRGELLAFLRVVAVRTGMALARRETAAAGGTTDDGGGGGEPADPADDPELRLLRELYGAEFKRAFADAMAALDDEERMLLRYHLLDGLSIDKLGAVLGVHRATAARRLERAREHLVKATRAALMKNLRVDREELDSIMRLVRSDLDVSARRVLAG